MFELNRVQAVKLMKELQEQKDYFMDRLVEAYELPENTKGRKKTIEHFRTLVEQYSNEAKEIQKNLIKLYNGEITGIPTMRRV